MPADGSAPPRQLTRPEPGESHRWPSALPGGKAVLFSMRRRPDVESNDVSVLDLDSGEWKVVVRGGLAPRYAPSGHLLFSRGGALFAVAFDVATLRTSGSPVPVIEGVASESVNGAVAYDISQEGHLFYLPSRWRAAYRNRLVTVDRAGNRAPTACPEGPIWDVNATPDGAVAYLLRDELPPGRSGAVLSRTERSSSSREGTARPLPSGRAAESTSRLARAVSATSGWSLRAEDPARRACASRRPSRRPALRRVPGTSSSMRSSIPRPGTTSGAPSSLAGSPQRSYGRPPRSGCVRSMWTRAGSPS